MTVVENETSVDTGRKVPNVVSQVLRLRNSRRERSQMRRASMPTSREYALPYIGHYLNGYSDEAVFKFTGLCSSFNEVRQNDDLSFGRALRIADTSKKVEESPLARRLFAMQRQPLRIVDSTMRSLFNISEISSVDWTDVYWLLYGWNNSDLNKRLKVRQRVLRDFYTYIPPEDSKDVKS